MSTVVSQTVMQIQPYITTGIFSFLSPKVVKLILDHAYWLCPLLRFLSNCIDPLHLPWDIASAAVIDTLAFRSYLGLMGSISLQDKAQKLKQVVLNSVGISDMQLQKTNFEAPARFEWYMFFFLCNLVLDSFMFSRHPTSTLVNQIIKKSRRHIYLHHSTYLDGSWYNVAPIRFARSILDFPLALVRGIKSFLLEENTSQNSQPSTPPSNSNSQNEDSRLKFLRWFYQSLDSRIPKRILSQILRVFCVVLGCAQLNAIKSSLLDSLSIFAVGPNPSHSLFVGIPLQYSMIGVGSVFLYWMVDDFFWVKVHQQKSEEEVEQEMKLMNTVASSSNANQTN